MIEELTTHLGSTGLMVVAVALLWWRAATVEKAAEHLLNKVEYMSDRISKIEGRLGD